jgi:Cupin-like domain
VINGNVAPMIAVEERAAATPDEFVEAAARGRPFTVRGLVKDWPLVEAGRAGAAQAIDYIASLDGGEAADVMVAPPSEQGRFFYREDFTGFNFARQSATLKQVGASLLELAANSEGPAIYAGAKETARHLPGFDAANPLPAVRYLADAKSRIWMCNRAEVATHFDLSDNIAAAALGRRRFTLFPPEVTGALYVGPLDQTIAGQPVSMVDPLRPDLARYPRFGEALERASFTELAPGDALYVPALWWHHVVALDPINILVNYWHNDHLRGGPFPAFVHALWAIRDLPDPQRRAWKAWFDHFIFGVEAQHASNHLPQQARGVNGEPSLQRDERMRQFLLRVLGA